MFSRWIFTQTLRRLLYNCTLITYNCVLNACDWDMKDEPLGLASMFNVQMASEVRTSFIIWLIFQPCLIASTGELRNPESGIHRLAPMLGSSGSSNQSYNCIWWLLNVLPGVCWSSLGWSRGGLHCLVVVTTEQWELRPPCGIQTTMLHNTPSISSIWEWCTPSIYSDLVDGLLLFCLH